MRSIESDSRHEAPDSSGPPEVRMFWTGPPLSPYEQLSLQSFVAVGARVFVYSTTKTLRVPEGVELVDVRKLLSGPVHRFIFPDGDPSPVLHSDLFRYAAIQRFGGWYADFDIVCVGKTLPRSKVYIARESDALVNGAVMKFPSQSPFIAAAIEEAWKLLPQAGPGAPLSARESIGPSLVTRLARDYALDHVIRPRSSAYAIGSHEIPAMFDPRRRDELDERVAGSDFVHLCNEYWRRVRIPKDLGPPAGSFLDGLFARFGFSFDDEARLSADAVAAWFEESRFLVQVRQHLRMKSVPGHALSILVGDAPVETAAPVAVAAREPASAFHAPVRTAAVPQTVNTFWAGGAIGPYQLLGLRSFADQGHRVQVFTFDHALRKPSWIEWRNAGDIIPADRVLREIPELGQSAIHANLFRHALLHRYGGWWIDPDVVLLRPDLPDVEMFVAGSNDAQIASTAAMKFPAGHPALAEVLIHSAPLDEAIERWEEAGAPLLTQCLAADGLLDQFQPTDVVSPVSWFDIEVMFDPDRADMLADKLQGALFLDLHQEAWLRAGVPRELGPPLGSYLDRLFKTHEIGWPFASRIEYGDLRRWLAHMYRCVGH
jgi:mannosyltransferase OCH1-like enzyme